jgi:DNA-binding LytR/AlgR family response regulator
MREPTAEIRRMPASTVRASPMTGLGATARRLIGPDWRRTYAIAIGMAVLLCFTGASNSAVLPIVPRFAYWLILMVAGTAVAQATDAWLDRVLRLALWQEVAIMTAAITPPIAVIVWLVSAAFSGRAPELRNLIGVVPPVVLISACMSIMHATVNRQPQQSHIHPATEPTAPTTAPGETFRARLEFRYRQADILALSAEDHYLRVHTSAGETLILMRLYDAIAELDGIEGSQIHRSWWVAKDAVRDVVRGDGKVDLVLEGGLRAPVSRRYQKALKADGWL